MTEQENKALAGLKWEEPGENLSETRNPGPVRSGGPK